MKWLFGPAAALILFAGAAQAGEFTGQALAEACAQSSDEERACLAYLQGFSDGYVHNDVSWSGYLRDNLGSGHLAAAATAPAVTRTTYCADDMIPAEVLRRDFVRWAAANPGALDHTASVVLFAALAETYPCQAIAPAAAEIAIETGEDGNG